MNTNKNADVYAVKDLGSGSENDGLCFFVHAAKFCSSDTPVFLNLPIKL